MNGFWEDKNVFVTGGSGLLGSHLIKKLLELKAHKIVVLVRDYVPKSLFFSEKVSEKVIIVDGKVEDFRLIERTLNESQEKFKLILNSKLDLSDRIIRTLLNDDILTSAITLSNKDIIEKRLNFYNPILDTFSIEVIDSQSNYYTNTLIHDRYKMNNQYRANIIKTASNDGGVFFLERESSLDIRYVMKRLHSNEILSVGFSIDRESFFINQLKNSIDAEIILNKGIHK